MEGNQYQEFIWSVKLDNDQNSTPNDKKQPDNIRWYTETLTFETLHEAHVWVYDDPYNKISYDYDGYKTIDEKIAYALLFELVRANTIFKPRFQIHADYEFAENHIIYSVWVTPLL